MKKIKLQLIVYLVNLFISFIIGWLGWMEQSVAFFWLQIVGLAIITLVVAYKARCNFTETVGVILVTGFFACIAMIPSFLIAWIFERNFFDVHEVVALISIFVFNCTNRKSEE